MIELDVWLTLDGQVVVSHDATLSRTAGRPDVRITETRYADLPLLSPRPNLNPGNSNDMGTTGVVGGSGSVSEQEMSRRVKHGKENQHCPANNNISDLKPPLLKHVFALVGRKVPIIVEVKQNSQELIEKVWELIYAHSRQDTTVWFSLSDAINAKLLARDPLLPRISSVREVLMLSIYYWIGALPFVSISSRIQGVKIGLPNLAALRQRLGNPNIHTSNSAHSTTTTATTTATTTSTTTTSTTNATTTAANTAPATSATTTPLLVRKDVSGRDRGEGGGGISHLFFRALPESAIGVLLILVRHLLGPHPKMVQHLQARGHLVWALIVNSEEDWQTAQCCKVDAILTDRPAWVSNLSSLQKKKH